MSDKYCTFHVLFSVWKYLPKANICTLATLLFYNFLLKPVLFYFFLSGSIVHLNPKSSISPSPHFKSFFISTIPWSFFHNHLSLLMAHMQEIHANWLARVSSEAPITKKVLQLAFLINIMNSCEHGSTFYFHGARR